MAFDESQKVKIRKYLGYPDVFRYANSRLENAIEVVGSRPDTQAAVEDVLQTLDNISQAEADFISGGSGGIGGISSIITTVGTGGLKSVGDDKIDFYQAGTTSSSRSSTSGGGSSTISPVISNIRELGRQHAGRLSVLFGIELWSDWFGKAGYYSDDWAGNQFQMGGPFRLG